MTVREAVGPELNEALELRRRVFCEEQGVSLEAERDGCDAGASHLIVISDGRVVGTCRVLFEGETARIGRMAVAGSFRGQGIGTALLAKAECLARERGARCVALHAQLSARRLYARNGYADAGAPFIEQGIEHVAMNKPLCPR